MYKVDHSSSQRPRLTGSAASSVDKSVHSVMRKYVSLLLLIERSSLVDKHIHPTPGRAFQFVLEERDRQRYGESTQN